MSDPMTVLAMTGATTVVAAMATSTWEATRERVVELFHRRGDERSTTVQAQLDGDAELIAGESEDSDGVREDLVRPWARRIGALLREHPETAEELRALIQEASVLPASQEWSQHITAHAGGAAFGAQGPGSSVHVHHSRPAAAEPPTPA
ncbi:hypothetical protein SAVIM338S_00128 [Streptomyces avidinii]